VIHFVVRHATRWGIDDYLASWGRPMADRIATVSYEDLLTRTQLETGTYIFTQKDELLPSELDLATLVWAQLEGAPGVRLLNHPQHAMGRLELLQTLHREGINEFTAARATDDPRSLRYPVFLREERRHTGALSPLLHSSSELDRALGHLLFRGWRRSDLLAVEFCDTADGEGVFRKYSAYVVGGVVIGRGILHSGHWMVKSATKATDERRAREELEFVEACPHRAWLADVAKLASIDYGRVDYGVKGERPQAWEINLHPTLVPSTDGSPAAVEAQRLRRPARAAFFRQFHEVLGAIDAERAPEARPSKSKVAIRLSGELRARIRTDRRQQRLRSLRGVITRRLAGWSPMRPLWNSVRPLILKLSGPVGRVSGSKE
jgi:hypothetical protein